VDLFLFAEVQGQVPQIPPASQEAKGARFASQPKNHYGGAPQAEFEAPDLSPLANSPHVLNDALLVSLSNRPSNPQILFVISKKHGVAIELIKIRPFLTSIRGSLAADRHLDKAFYVAPRFEDINLK
jgi:hypothetical protein